MAAMREDMFEVIIERPRCGSRMGHRRRARRMDANVDVRRDPEAMPLQIGLSRWTKMGRSKMLNENLAPLRRYLERQVNRPWDKVWSEISENLSASSTVQQHVRDHVGDFVAFRTLMKDGVIQAHRALRRAAEPAGEPLPALRRSAHRAPAQEQILRKLAEEAARQCRPQPSSIARRACARSRRTVQAHRLDDNCWWEIRLAPIPTRIVTYPSPRGSRQYRVRDKFTDVVVSAKLSQLPIDELYGRDGVFAASSASFPPRDRGPDALRLSRSD